MEDERIRFIEKIDEGVRKYLRFGDGVSRVVDINERTVVLDDDSEYEERVCDLGERILFIKKVSAKKGDSMYTFIQRQPQLYTGNVFVSQDFSNGERIDEAARRAFSNLPRHDEESDFYQPPLSEPKETK